jgi:hypothetical protein
VNGIRTTVALGRSPIEISKSMREKPGKMQETSSAAFPLTDSTFVMTSTVKRFRIRKASATAHAASGMNKLVMTQASSLRTCRFKMKKVYRDSPRRTVRKETDEKRSAEESRKVRNGKCKQITPDLRSRFGNCLFRLITGTPSGHPVSVFPLTLEAW